jgi:ribosomal protein S18 acetylase RimI-like enzyme
MLFDPDVRMAMPEEKDRVVATLALAFANDPVTRWVFSDPHQYLAVYPAFVTAFGGGAFDHGAAYRTDDFAGGALWLPPEVHSDEAALDALMARSLAADKKPVVGRMLDEMAGYHPEEPHWDLPLIGVDPMHQGRGYGASLLRKALERVDLEGRAAYLESSNPANVPLYQRHGFEVVGRIQIEDAPPLIPMVRPRRRNA